MQNRLTRMMWMLIVSGFLASSAVSDERGGTREESEFVPIFDGRSLEGWHAYPENTKGDWKVRNGVIAGIGSANRQSYLVWKEQDLTDFELRFQYRMVTKGNSGVEIHARKDKSGKRPYEGYHADFGDVSLGPNVLGAWDFHFARRREHPCPRGTSLVIHEDESASATTLKDSTKLEDIRKREWNRVRIVARGNHFKFFLNGKLASEFTDNAREGQLTSGAIGLQLHDKGMQVEFKDLRLKSPKKK